MAFKFKEKRSLLSKGKKKKNLFENYFHKEPASYLGRIFYGKALALKFLYIICFIIVIIAYTQKVAFLVNTNV